MEPRTNSGRVGRPVAFNQERAARAVEAIRQGHTRRAAAQAAGISAATLFKWLDYGDRVDAPPEYLDFLERVRDAEAGAECDLVDIVLAEAKSGSWRAAAWLLERRHRDEWAAKSKLELASPPLGAKEREVQAIIDEGNESAALMMRVAEYAGRGVPLESWPPEVRRAAGLE
jgi:hypothetical protein